MAAALRRISSAARRLYTGAAAAVSSISGPAAQRMLPEWVPLYRRLSALGPAGPSASAAAAMDRWVQEGGAVSEEQLLAYVRQLRRYKQNKHALELMDWMEACGVNMQLGHHALRIDLISRVKGIHMAEEYFSSLPDLLKSRRTYSALLNCYAEHRMADRALELYDKMKALNIASGTLVHNNLMALYLKIGQLEKIPGVFQEMRENGTSADSFTYSLLTQSYALLNDLESAEKVLEALEQEEIPVHWSLYSNLASHYNKLEQFDKAELALKKVEEVMDKHVMFAWHFLITLYAGAGNLAEVKRVWESLKSAFRKCTNRSYLMMLKSLRKLNDIDSLKQIFEEWESNHEHYDMRILNVMMAACLDKDMVDEAEAVRERAMADGHSNIVTFYIFVEYYLKKSQMDSALKCWRDARNWVKKDDWVPQKELVNRFLQRYEESKDVDGLESFCECLKKLNCLDAEVYEALLRTYVAAGRTNPSIAQRMEDDGIEIRSETAKLLKKCLP